MNLPHIYARPDVCKFLRLRARRDKVKPAAAGLNRRAAPPLLPRRLRKHPEHRFRLEFNYIHSLAHLVPREFRLISRNL